MVSTTSTSWIVGGLSYGLSIGTTSAHFTAGGDRVDTSPGGGCGLISQLNESSFSTWSSVNLPNGQQYSFTYDSQFGMINQLTYPDGAWVQYTWGVSTDEEAVSTSNGNAGPCIIRYHTPVITDRVVGNGVGSAPVLKQHFSYQTTWADAHGPYWSSKTTTVSTTDLVTGRQTQTVYTYAPAFGPNLAINAPGGYQAQTAVESSVKDYDSGTLLQTVNDIWADPYQKTSEQIVLPNGLSSQTVNCYYAGTILVQEKDEYDFGVAGPSPGSLQTSPGVSPTCGSPAPSRKTTYGGYLSPRVSCQTIVYDGNGNRSAETDVYTDNATAFCTQGPGGTAAATTPAGTHDETLNGPNSGPHGNITRVDKWLNTGGFVTTTASYDETGQVVSTTDPCGNASCGSMIGSNHTTTYSYTDSPSGGNAAGASNAYLTQITDPLGHTQNFSYNYTTGELASATDANGKTATYTYADPLNRLTLTSLPDGGSTSVAYDDSAHSVTTTVTATPDPSISSVAFQDGMGRVTQTQLTSDPAGVTYVDTTYDGEGRVYTVSNPHRSGSSPTDGTTTYAYDALGRVTVQTQPDGSLVQWCYNGVSSGQASYVCLPNQSSKTAASWVDYSDEANRHAQRVGDALGRLTAVMEPVGNLPTLETDYSYDALNNLTDAYQYGVVGQDATRSRHFVYDSLSRLLTANNPETGIICYGIWSGSNCVNGYDANGNLLAKTDARGMSTSYNYDLLNRLTSKTYSDSTPPSNYYYDVASTNGIGRLSTATVGGANVYAKYYYQYDAVGRLLRKNFQLPNAAGNGMQSNIGASGDTYDLAGHVIFTDTGVGVHEMFTRDSAGHVVNATSNAHTTGFLNGIASTNIYLNASYTPLGGLATRTLGNGLTETRSYDNRGRQTSTTQAQAGSSIGYSVTTGYDPASNVTSVNDSVNGNWTYVYDSLNRLHTAFSAAGLNLDWEYDAFGNRLSQTPSGTGSAPQMNLQFTNPANRVDPGNNIVYDAAGNVTTDNQGQTYTYDAEERISSMTHLGGAPTVYKYDSEGNLVYESGASGVQVFLRNAAGQPVTIAAPSGYTGPSPYQNTIAYVDGEDIGLWHNSAFNWSGKDTVGTKRYVSGGKGDLASSTQPQLIGTFTSLPFGDALSSIGTSPIHFTSKERDLESNLDYFGARHYSSSVGNPTNQASEIESVTTSALRIPKRRQLLYCASLGIGRLPGWRVPRSDETHYPVP